MANILNKSMDADTMSVGCSSSHDCDPSVSTMLRSDRAGETTETASATNKSDESMTMAETKAVNQSKRCILILLGFAAVGASIMTFCIARGAQEDLYHKQFNVNVYEIQDHVDKKWHSAQVAIDNLAISMASAAMAAGALTTTELPSFAMPFFGMHSQDVVDLSAGAALAVGLAAAVEEGSTFGNIHLKLPITHLYPESGLPLTSGNLLSDPELNDMFLDMVVHSKPLQAGLRAPNFIEFPDPHSMLLAPIIEPPQTETEAPQDKPPVLLGVAFSVLSWNIIFKGVLSPESGKMVAVLQDSCDAVKLTFELNGPNSTLLAHEDLDYHQVTENSSVSHKYNDMESVVYLHSLSSSSTNMSNCDYTICIYSTQDLESIYITPMPYVYATVVFLVVVMFIGAFIAYDKFVQNRQEKVLAKAARSNAIVASLFPSNVRDRILQQAEEQAADHNKKYKNKLGTTGKNQLKNFLADGLQQANNSNGTSNMTSSGGIIDPKEDSKPIADLFPKTTVMFADIAGFTAWSSIREPCQVFELLETLYNSFDDIAGRRRVFKVETIGDCYVAVCGLPEPRKEHAMTMVRFARDLLTSMKKLTSQLEMSLGPDTGDLSLRIGLHSGPVTAGVLRGNNCRFQLFGDTVNTAARMESNGKRDAIHISEETANLIKAANKEHWLIEREDKIVAKGKGQLTTYFVTTKKAGPASVTTSGSDSVGTNENSGTEGISMSTAGIGLSSRIKRLVTFNADLVARLLKAVVARRDAEKVVKSANMMNLKASVNSPLSKRVSMHGGTVIDEVKDILTLPKFNAKAAMKQQDPKTVVLDEVVVKQIHSYVMVLATMYRKDVPFHNFEHASHVTMSVSKLLSRIVAPDTVLSAAVEGNEDEIVKKLHEHTYGITSDPMTQFAAVIAALIHDVDHTGVPNTQLVKEGTRLAEFYKNKSVAEQNSVDLAWDLLMDDQFKDMRAVIYTNREEEKHFRSLLVNLVLATDICDSELGAQRKARWAKAFSGDVSSQDGESEHDAVNRKATIVLEHLIQASDVAHTMQHWHIYRKWNEKFFEENMKAFRSGRAEKNPATVWYEGELGFFDFYIIPLAKKLKECGVFGVASDEYLDYAEKNRKEWLESGQAAVAEMAAKYLPTLDEEDDEVSCFEGEGEGDDSSESGSFDSTSVLAMDATTIFNCNESWELLRRMPNYEERAGTILFSVLFVKCPTAKVLFGFPIGMCPTSEALTSSNRFLTHARYMIQMLDKALALLGPDAEALSEILGELGKKHVRLGVKEDFFPIMGEALMEALQQMLGDSLTQDMKDAWAIVYNALSSEMIRSMNTDKAVLFSWNKLKQIENYQEVAGVILFRKLFILCPDSKLLFGFPADMDVQSEKILSSRRFVSHAAYFIEMLDKALGMVENKEIGTEMTRLGQMHVQFGVKEEYFTLMGDALFDTLSSVLKKSWDARTEDAWREVYGRLASSMVQAMRDASGDAKLEL